jgi:hypothetical protein
MTNTAQKISHTPGPWHVTKHELFHIDRGDIDAFCVHAPGGLPVCRMGGNVSQENVEANARLIAAAPAMYEALKRAQWELNDIAQHGGRAGDESMKMIAEALAEVQS